MKYVTKDGKEFNTLKEAKAHEKTLRPTPRARSTADLEQAMVDIVLRNPNGSLAAQVITLSNQIRARRKVPGGGGVGLSAPVETVHHCAAEQDFPL